MTIHQQQAASSGSNVEQHWKEEADSSFWQTFRVASGTQMHIVAAAQSVSFDASDSQTAHASLNAPTNASLPLPRPSVHSGVIRVSNPFYIGNRAKGSLPPKADRATTDQEDQLSDAFRQAL